MDYPDLRGAAAHRLRRSLAEQGRCGMKYRDEDIVYVIEGLTVGRCSDPWFPAGKYGYDFAAARCPLMTQSGHFPPRCRRA